MSLSSPHNDLTPLSSLALSLTTQFNHAYTHWKQVECDVNEHSNCIGGDLEGDVKGWFTRLRREVMELEKAVRQDVDEKIKGIGWEGIRLGKRTREGRYEKVVRNRK